MAKDSPEPLSTGCKSLDEMLNGGVRQGEVTLVYGEPSTGKTSLAIQCAVACAKRGLKTIFVDSENTFSPNRLAQIAGSKLDEVSTLIFVFKPRSFQEQSSLIDALANYNLSSIALVVVDTVTALYRAELGPAENIFALNMELNWQLAYLNELARNYGTAVLLTGQVRSVVRGGLAERIEPVANRLLKFWAQTVISLRAVSDSTTREAILEKELQSGELIRCLYVLVENGMVSASK